MKPRNNTVESGFTLIEILISVVLAAFVAIMLATYFGQSITLSGVPISRLKAAGDLNEIIGHITADYNNNPPTWSPNTTYTAKTIIVPTGARKKYRYVCTTTGTSGATEPVKWFFRQTIIDNTVRWEYSSTIPPKNWVANTPFNKNQIVYPGNGYQYLSIIAGTSHPTTQPTWPTTIDSQVADGTVTWECRGPEPLASLKERIGAEGTETNPATFNGQSVKYRVIHNRFIKFDTGVSPATEVDLTGSAGDADYGRYLKVTIGLHSTASPRTDETITTLFVRR